MNTTEFRKTAQGTYLRATYGLHTIGSQAPYWSVTGDEYSKPIAKERYSLSCGQLHDQIRATFPELADAIRWHLCTDGEPMHYMANARYWHQLAIGVAVWGPRDLGASAKVNERELANAPSAFASTTCLGVLSDDPTVDDLLARPWADVESVLAARLPRMRETFRAMVAQPLLIEPTEATVAPEDDHSFGVTMKAVYQGLADEMFVWTVELTCEGRQYNYPFKMGLAHCTPLAVNIASSRIPREKLNAKLARALKPFGKLTISDTQGYVRPTEPTVDAVLDCLRSDAQAGAHMLFEDFASEFDYDVDSREGERIWRACQETRGKLQKLLGEAFEAFMSEVSR